LWVFEIVSLLEQQHLFFSFCVGFVLGFFFALGFVLSADLGLKRFKMVGIGLERLDKGGCFSC
jgi:hypothetical protein